MKIIGTNSFEELDKKISGPPGEIPPRVPGTTPPRRVGSCQGDFNNLTVQESVLEFVENSIVVVVIIFVVIATIIVVVELSS